MKTITFLIAFISLIVSSTQDPISNYNSFKGYSFWYDESKWEIKENQNLTFLFDKKELSQKSGFKTNLNIIIQDFPSGKLEDYHNITLRQIELVLGKDVIISDKYIQISGKKGKELIYIMPGDIAGQRKETIKFKQTYFVEGDKAYLLTYTSNLKNFNKHLKSADKVFETFTVK